MDDLNNTGQVEAKGVSEDSKPYTTGTICPSNHIYGADFKSCPFCKEPKEPTKSFEDSIEQTLNELSGYEGLTAHGKGCHYHDETIGCTCDYTADQNTKKEVHAALAAIKATVEKHYQLKEEA